MSHQLDEKRKEHLSNAKSLNADIEQYPEHYADLSQKERRNLSLETENKESTQMPLFLARRRKIMLFLMLKTVSRSINLARYIKEQKKMRRQEKTWLISIPI